MRHSRGPRVLISGIRVVSPFGVGRERFVYVVMRIVYPAVFLVMIGEGLLRHARLLPTAILTVRGASGVERSVRVAAPSE